MPISYFPHLPQSNFVCVFPFLFPSCLSKVPKVSKFGGISNHLTVFQSLKFQSSSSQHAFSSTSNFSQVPSAADFSNLSIPSCLSFNSHQTIKVPLPWVPFLSHPQLPTSNSIFLLSYFVKVRLQALPLPKQLFLVMPNPQTLSITQYISLELEFYSSLYLSVFNL